MAVIEISDLCYSYPGSKVKILDGLALEVGKGEIVAVIGKSGCGKSTLLLTLNRIIPASLGGRLTGSIRINGKSIHGKSTAELGREVQIMFQNPESQFFSFNVRDEIAFGLENRGLSPDEADRRVDEVLSQFQICHLENRSVEELSSGEKQLVILASLVAMKPDVLVLDEPTANLDPIQTRRLMKLLKEINRMYGMTILFSEHSPDFIGIADRILVLENGCLNEYGGGCGDVRISSGRQVLKKNRGGSKKTILEAEKLHCSYDSRPVLKGIDFELEQGDFAGLVGFNGCGKSTLALNIMRLLKLDAGKILFAGQDVTREKTCEIAKSIGYVFQNPDYALFENSVRDEIRFGAKNCGIKNRKLNSNVRQIASALGLAHLLDRDPSNLSVGEKRRVNIASVLAMDPKIIILDEPDTGLDRFTSLKLMNHLAKLNKESGTTVLIISHNLELVDEFCNNKIFIEDGKVRGIDGYYAKIAEASR